MAPGLANARPPGQCKIWKCPTLGTDKAGKKPEVGGGGWGGKVGADEIDEEA